ncbi:hypothetical protein CsSME_00020731 [Camellia sinensis var. sinensis]
MLSGLKFTPRDQIDKEEDLDDSRKEKRKLSNRKENDIRKKKSSRYGSFDEDDLERVTKGSRKRKSSRYGSSNNEGLERITKGSRKKKKWYSSYENSTYSTESESEGDFD